MANQHIQKQANLEIYYFVNKIPLNKRKHEIRYDFAIKTTPFSPTKQPKWTFPDKARDRRFPQKVFYVTGNA